MRRKLLMAALVAGAAAAFTMYTPPSLHERSRERMIERNKLIANHLYDELDKSLGTPITIARTMAADEFLKDALRREDSIGQTQFEASMTEYLSAIRKQFGYTSAFVVSEHTRCYYTPGGIAKIVNPEQDPYDIWYQLFLDSGKSVDLDTDRDQVNDYRWTVFVNARITDSDGSLMGVCGLGLFMDELQEFLDRTESEWGLKVNLVDDSGLVQADVDPSNIENAYISDAIADAAGPDSFTYAKRGFGGFRMTRYMDKLEWYLVVQGADSVSGGDGLSVPRAVTVYLILLALLIVILLSPTGHSSHALVKTHMPEDPLTGLPNRNYLNDAYGELGVFNTTRYKSLAMFDVDKFKIVNETMDGDAILLKIVQISRDLFGDSGLIFRWSGDEFVFFLEMEAEEAEAKFNTLCDSVFEATGVTISVGIVEVDLFESIKRNYHRAVQQCYIVKEAGGNGVSRKA